MNWGVDVSMGMKWLISEDHSDVADRVLTSSDELHAPRLMASKIANTISRKARLGEIGRDLATILIASGLNLPVLWHCDEEFCASACDFAIALRYRVSASVLTTDVRFVNALRTTQHRAMAISSIGFR